MRTYYCNHACNGIEEISRAGIKKDGDSEITIRLNQRCGASNVQLRELEEVVNRIGSDDDRSISI